MKHKAMSQTTPRFRRWTRKNWSVFASFHREVSIGVLSASMSLLLLLPQGVSAHKTDTTNVQLSVRIAEVDVSGIQSSPISNALSQTPLFDRKAHAASPAQTLEAALRMTPSVDLRQRGGKGTQADISIRGGSFDQTMVLLNGIDFTDARTGHQSHSLPIDLDCISSVELIDGLPGVGAYAGAVHIRTAPLLPTYIRLDAQGGQHGYAYTNLSGAWSSDRFSVFAAGSYRRSDGYRYNTDFDTYNAFLRLSGDARRWGFFEFQTGYQNRQFGSNGFYAAYNPDQWEKTSTALASLRWTKRFDEHFAMGASLGYRKNFDRYDWTRGEAMNYHNTDNLTAKLWCDYAWRRGVTSVGGDYAFNHIYSTNLGEELNHPHGKYLRAKSRNTGNIWLRHAREWSHFDLKASVGVALTPYDHEMSWSVAGGYRSPWGLRIEAGVWRSMRLPTFTDLYYTSPAQINNLDLVPEMATNCRLNLNYRSGNWSVNLNSYYRRGRHIIDWVWREDLGNKWHSEQTNSLKTYGVELSGGYTSQQGFLRRLFGSYGYTTTDQDTDLVTQNAMDFLRHKAVVNLEVALLRNVTFALTGTLAKRNGNYTAYPVVGDASQTVLREFETYFTLDGRLQWQKKSVRIYVDCTNITDRHYFDLGGIPLPGTWLSAGMTLTIGK